MITIFSRVKKLQYTTPGENQEKMSSVAERHLDSIFTDDDFLTCKDTAAIEIKSMEREWTRSSEWLRDRMKHPFDTLTRQLADAGGIDPVFDYMQTLTDPSGTTVLDDLTFKVKTSPVVWDAWLRPYKHLTRQLGRYAYFHSDDLVMISAARYSTDPLLVAAIIHSIQSLNNSKSINVDRLKAAILVCIDGL